MAEMIEAQHLVYRYPPEIGADGKPGAPNPPTLRDVSLTIRKGSFTAVLGHNGSGKSTFAKHINAILLPEEGTMRVDGMDTADESCLFAIRQKAGMVFQNPDNQIVATIVEEDVAFAPENLGVEPKEIRRRVDEALKAVGMYEYRNHAPSQLSGGQKQRVAIAGVIAMQPDCIVLDEPTAMLDPKGRQEVMETIRRLNREQGITIVLITHYMEEAAEADRVVVIDSGEVVMDDTPPKVFSQVEKMKALGLDVPQVTELAWELNQAGFAVSPEIITEEECLAALRALLSRASCAE
ncbi:MAG: energy-coupling factor transporter ATPase [Oscillospiraceae bacterium]|nr:energy-coupling factor transporter ATPase [Oscillospiraceae bacterium]